MKALCCSVESHLAPASYAMQDRHALQVICHGIPDKRPLQDGDIVNVDVTAYYKGYHGDLNETYVVGQVDEEGKKLIKCAHDVSLQHLHVTLLQNIRTFSCTAHSCAVVLHYQYCTALLLVDGSGFCQKIAGCWQTLLSVCMPIVK